MQNNEKKIYIYYNKNSSNSWDEISDRSTPSLHDVTHQV